MDLCTQVQILNEAFCIVFVSLGKVWTQLHPHNYNKVVGQTELFNFDMATSLEEEKLWI